MMRWLRGLLAEADDEIVDVEDDVCHVIVLRRHSGSVREAIACDRRTSESDSACASRPGMTALQLR